MFEKLREGLNGIVNKISKTELKTEKIRPYLSDFKLTLIENDVAVSVADHVCKELEERLKGVVVKRLEDRKKIVKDYLFQILKDILATNEDIDLIEMVKMKRRTREPYIIVFIGINGTGKTTTIAKVTNLLMKHNCSVVLACSDTYRAGSIEQLGEHSKRLGVRMIKHGYGADPAAVAYDAVNYARSHGIDSVLIDTAGRIQTNRNLMNELTKIKKVTHPDLTILTVDALTGNDAVMQAEEFHKRIGINGTILTKVDADVKGGASLSVAFMTGKPILFIGTGQDYEDLQEFSPKQFARTILE